MVETAGTKLRRARTLRRLSIEDAARVTKIRPRQIADLERDEYSNFANLAYARSFLIGYAKFLDLDLRSHLEAFEDASTFGLDDYQYLSEVPVGIYRAPTRRFKRRKRRGRLVAAGATLGVLAIVVTGWFFVVSFRRLGDLDKLAARQEAREHATSQADNTNATRNPAGVQPPTIDPARIEAIPVSAPVSQSPAPIPANDQTVTTPAALVATENATAVPVGTLTAPVAGNTPAVPLPGDGSAARALTQGADFRATLAGAPAGLADHDAAANAQAKIRAAKPVPDPANRAADPYQGNVPQPVSNNSLR